MRRLVSKIVLVVWLLLVGNLAAAQDAVQLRNHGVALAAQGDYAGAAPYLSKAAHLGYYTAQIEYAVLMDTSPAPVNDDIKAYAWYSLVIARRGTDTDFAKECRAKVAKRMSAADLTAAQQLAAKLISQFGKPEE